MKNVKHSISVPTAIWSSDWSERAGQTIVTKRVYEHQTGIDWIVATYGAAGAASVLGVFHAVARLYYAALTRQFGQVYLVSSRSMMGFLRDLPALFLVFFGIRVVAHVHGSDILYLLKDSPLSRIASILYRRCEMIVPSHHLVADVKSLLGKTPLVCENFVDIADLEALDNNHPSHNVVLITWNSNVMSSKGVFDLARAVSIARDSDQRFQLLVIGSPLGDCELTREQARNKLNSLATEKWVTYLGSVPPSEALRATQQADIYVFPSRYPSECQPLALIQAMMLAKPILVSDTPALRATLGGYPASFLPSPSPDDLACAMLETVRKTKIRSEQLELAAQIARQRFSADRFDKVMREILHRPAIGRGT